MLVFWKGPLHVVPTDTASAAPLEEGKSIVHLIGTPVMVHEPANGQQEATDVQCTDLFYRTADSGGTTRLSFGPFLSKQDVKYATDALAEIAATRAAV